MTPTGPIAGKTSGGSASTSTAHLHSRVDVVETDGLVLRLHYDPHYCRHFAQHPSQWTLELSDRYVAKLGKTASLAVDGKAETLTPVRRQTIAFGTGVGDRSAALRPR